MENFYQQLQALPANLSNHLMITVIPLSIGIAISLPLAVLLARRPRLRYPALTVVGVIQTIPSLALLALMVPILAAIGTLTVQLLGWEISALGFYPSVIALTLYSMLPIVRNGVTGILEVDPALIEAARAVGMTDRQMLWKVELPLAAPIVIAGIRTATVWVVGIATLATPVGQRCLGNYIFFGLQTRNWTAVLFGCISAALLAILLDTLIGTTEKAVRTGNQFLKVLSIALLLLILLAGLLAPSLVSWGRSETMSYEENRDVVWIGTKTFTEQYILASLISKVLEKEGFQPRNKQSLGSTVVFDALAQGEIDCYVDYSGTIWANFMNRSDTADAEIVLEEISDWLEQNYGILNLGSLGFENAYGLAVTSENADRLDLDQIGDLKPWAPSMKIGGDYEFFGRPEWQSIRKVYGLTFSDQISYDSTFMYKALVEGQVDVISAFTSDGRVSAFDLNILNDPEQAIPPYDAVLLLSRQAASQSRLVEALQPLIGSIPIEVMRQANYQVDRNQDKKTVDQATEWLLKQVFAP